MSVLSLVFPESKALDLWFITGFDHEPGEGFDLVRVFAGEISFLGWILCQVVELNLTFGIILQARDNRFPISLPKGNLPTVARKIPEKKVLG